MIARALLQGGCIAAVALAIGTVHALVNPLRTWDSEAPRPQPVPVNPPAPPADTTGTAPTVPQGQPPAVPAPAVPAVPRDDRMITLERLKEMLAGAVPVQVVDAREPHEFEQGRIPGAINLPPSAFSGGIPDAVNQRMSRDLAAVVYCSGGNCDASKSVAMRLKDMGFSQVFVYEDDYTGWTKAGEAVEK